MRTVTDGLRSPLRPYGLLSRLRLPAFGGDSRLRVIGPFRSYPAMVGYEDIRKYARRQSKSTGAKPVPSDCTKNGYCGKPHNSYWHQDEATHGISAVHGFEPAIRTESCTFWILRFALRAPHASPLHAIPLDRSAYAVPPLWPFLWGFNPEDEPPS